MNKRALFAATILDNPYIPHDPTVKQARFLLHEGDEVFYGGAAGGGKSDALLMAALQYVEFQNYAALLLRRTYADLALPGALMDRAWEWLAGTDAKAVDGGKSWEFPSGATLVFGYVDAEKDKFRYQSSEFQFVGFDELTHFTETQYTYLHSRLRRLEGSDIPIRMRSASNPGGIGHEWVKSRFITGDLPFIPATLADNPHIDQEAYMGALNKLDLVTRSQLLEGDWDIGIKGNIFRIDWWRYFTEWPPRHLVIQSWDTAFKKGQDNDYSVCTTWVIHENAYYCIDLWRGRVEYPELRRIAIELYERWKPSKVLIEDKASGQSLIQELQRGTRIPLVPVRVDSDKTTRAHAASPLIESGRVYLPRGADWTEDLVRECSQFPNGAHDDIVDSITQFLNSERDTGKVYFRSW